MNILTFDIEEWFHILDNSTTKTVNEWKDYESRIKANLDKILTLLQDHKVKATFFILGWIAEKYPELVKLIDSLGYEIGSHSYFHQLAYEQDEKQFRSDTEQSVKKLEDIIGKKIKYYRIPGFSLTERTIWAFEALINLGIEIDSSVFPAERGHGGYPEFSSISPCIIDFKGKILKEFPVNTIKLIGKNIIFSGGGYFRLFPYKLIRNWSNKAPYIMTYFHPRDFDSEQPLIKNLSALRRFKSYYGLSKTYTKLEKWLNDFEFIDIGEADKLIDWSKSKYIKY
ncbi:MAG: polysaccharide deacetylase family protein [Bacteroidales bacterium]|nr:polysaccharide deacetylase family protein [Bacteroidales bacterium]